MRKINNIVVVGGGTAGWLTALLAKRYQPNKNVILIESEAIGILGAGEGTVPNFIHILKTLEIDVADVIKECKATIKTGIVFTNWNGRGKDDRYFHAFDGFNELSIDAIDVYQRIPLSLIISKYMNEDRCEIDYLNNLSFSNKVPFIPAKNDNNGIFPNHRPLASFALHFDARLLAKFFKKIALSRGIQHVDGIVSHFDEDATGNIVSINLDNNQKIESDFIFDCSGFARLIIGKHYKTEWKMIDDILPCDSAIPFFIQNTDQKLEPYTEAIALKNGWVWKIPVQGRYGCGYVYDSKHTTEDDAKQEVRDWFGFDVDFPTKFKFTAGHYEKFWIKNCIGVGLSSGFLEPLEATSIWITTHMIERALGNFEQMEMQNQDFIDDYNLLFNKRFEDTISFLSLHYMTKRTDSDFWIKCKTLNTTETLKRLLNLWENKIPSGNDIDLIYTHYHPHSWISVLDGIEYQEKNVINSYVNENNIIDRYMFGYYRMKQDVSIASNHSLDHYQFIQQLL